MSRSAWLTLLALSCAASAAGVRLARPFALDDLPAALLLLALVPSALILLIALLRRPVGVLVALLMPVFWLYIASRPDESLLLWTVPLAAGGLLIALVRAAQERPLPRAVPIVAIALALAAFLLPAPGRPAAGPRAVVVGVEGATWESIDRLVAGGRLPHLAGLQETGRRAHLRASATHHPCEMWHTLLEAAGPGDFVLPGSCAPDGRRYPPETAFLAALDRATMPRGTAEAAIAIGRPAGSVSVGAVLDAVRRGARLSTLRRAVADLIARRGRSGDLDPGQAARTRAWFWDLEGDVFTEQLRGREARFAALLLTSGGPSAKVPDEQYEAFDRGLGKLLRAAPANVNIVIGSIPDAAVGGVFLISGAAATHAAAADTLDVPAAVAVVAAVLGLPPAPSSPGASIGSE